MSKYGLARKYRDSTGRKEFCLAVFSGDYPHLPVHWFGLQRPAPSEILEVAKRGPELLRVSNVDYALQFFPYGSIDFNYPIPIEVGDNNAGQSDEDS